MSEYERYQLQWMIDHGYSMMDLMNSLTELQYFDPEDSDQISTPVNELFRQWVADRGFDSEIWACEKEWEEHDCECDFFSFVAERLRDYSEGAIWSAGGEILVMTESAAEAVADLIESLYRSNGEEVLVNTGYYDPDEDKWSGEEDRFTGWWYVNIC